MSEVVRVKIKYHDPDMPRIKAAHDGEWFDMRAAEDVFVPQGCTAVVSLGVSMEIEKGYEAIIAPRSSTPKNYGVTMPNSLGIIDNAYKGDNDIWRCICYGITDKDTAIINGVGVRGTWIRKYDRICQFRIQKTQPNVIFEEVDHLGNENRGGLGSTGKR